MSAVTVQQRCITVNGKKKILLCASLFYFRIPREDWQQRMTDLRSCGYNCIDVYFPWNFHELHPDDWHFEGMHDCAAFLELAAKNDLYVIARPGPYICSEWDGGALPAWLNDVCPVIRQNESGYLQYLSRWLYRILPIIANHEAGKGGSVVALQLENELDFFACKEPGAYMEQLRVIARASGITVPLIACAGECDVQGAGGTMEGVHPTFNAYCADNFPYLECQLEHMRLLAARRDTPLMITETNREHSLLKRELLSGARLISPYNQVGGTDTEMTNGISNWASDPIRPLALMATDYDFHSMLTVDGRKRAEALQGRLLGILIESLGELLAEGEPVDCPVRVQCDFSTARYLAKTGEETGFYPAVKTRAGILYGVTNTGDKDGRCRIKVEDADLSSLIPAERTRIYPWQFSLEAWGARDLILWSEAELSSVCRKGNAVSVTFIGNPDERVCILHEGKKCIISGEDCVGSVRIRIVDAETAAREHFEPFPDLMGSIPSEICTERILQAYCANYAVAEHAVSKGREIRPMEDYGVYRGDIFYKVNLESPASLLLTDAADFVWLSAKNRKDSYFGDGSTRLIENVPAGEVSIRVQSWGHVNFDDVRQPSLKMGSKKGISGIYRVNGVQDITDLWTIYPDAKYTIQGKPELKSTDCILATTVNSWSYPVSPMKADFIRPVYLREDSDSWFVFIEHLNGDISAAVNGGNLTHFRAENHFAKLDLNSMPGGPVRLCLTVNRRFSHDSLGHVLLYHCSRVEGTGTSIFPVESWQKLTPEAEGNAVSLPLRMIAGEECLLTGFGMEKLCRAGTLVLDGEGLEATLCGHGHVIGRVQLKTADYPEVRGGSSRRIYVPESWNDEEMVLHLSALGKEGTLAGISWEMIHA